MNADPNSPCSSPASLVSLDETEESRQTCDCCEHNRRRWSVCGHHPRELHCHCDAGSIIVCYMSHLSISARVDEPMLTCSWGIVHEIRVARNARVVVARDDIYAVWVCRALERRDNIADHSIFGDASRGRLEVVWDLSANYKYRGYKKMDDKSHGNGHAPPRGRSERPHLGCNPIASGAYTAQRILYNEPGTS